MKPEDFKQMMRKYFGFDGKEVKVIEENPEYIEMEVDMSIPGLPVKLNEGLYWRKEEIDFCKSLENENVEFLAHYHRLSPRIQFDQRAFYFMITDKNGEKYPNYFVIYNKEKEVVIGDEKDFFFPRNEKQNETIEVLEEEVRILKSLIDYYEPKFKEIN